MSLFLVCTFLSYILFPYSVTFIVCLYGRDGMGIHAHAISRLSVGVHYTDQRLPLHIGYIFYCLNLGRGSAYF